MNRKILALAMITFSLAISGCQELPPTQEPPAPKIETQTPPSENPKIEKPVAEKPENKNVNPKTETEQNTETVVSPATQTKMQKIKVKAYFPDDAGINLVAVNRTVEVASTADKYLAAIQLLINVPKEKDLTAIFPKNAKLHGVTFKDGTAFVDFDSNITKSFAGGSTGEELLVASVVKTLTEFPEVKQVRFLVDGKEIETLSGHMDLSTPIKKSDL